MTPKTPMQSREAQTVHRTPNPTCPACQAKRLHTEQERETYHPLRTTGIDKIGVINA